MATRRMPSARPASSEEIECWTQAAGQLTTLSQICTSAATAETIQRVNRLMAGWPTEDELPPDGLEGLRSTARKLEQGFLDIKRDAEEEVRMINEASERISVLLALRRASESAPINDKRMKRPRAESNISTASSPAPRVSIVLPARPTPQPMKGRRDKDASLQEGRRVALSQEENSWMVAIILRVINTEKKGIMYEVVDAEDEVGGTHFTVSSRSLLALPDPQGPPPEHAVGAAVVALYPETTCLYRAQVIKHWKDVPSINGKQYGIKFEEDDDQEWEVDAYHVVAEPRNV